MVRITLKRMRTSNTLLQRKRPTLRQHLNQESSIYNAVQNPDGKTTTLPHHHARKNKFPLNFVRFLSLWYIPSSQMRMRIQTV